MTLILCFLFSKKHSYFYACVTTLGREFHSFAGSGFDIPFFGIL